MHGRAPLVVGPVSGTPGGKVNEGSGPSLAVMTGLEWGEGGVHYPISANELGRAAGSPRPRCLGTYPQLSPALWLVTPKGKPPEKEFQLKPH